MAKKKKSSKKRKKARAKPATGLFKRTAIQILLILVCVFLSYCVWLNFQIKNEFEGKRWSVPARVYAQPTELYIGREYSREKLQQQLSALGYKPVRRLSGPGQFAVSGNQLFLYQRKFNFSDKAEPAKKLALAFEQSRISTISNMVSGNAVPIFRLEPFLIGKVFPLHDEDRVLVKLEDVPPALVNALVAIEDRNFFQHHGVDPKAILRSIYVNLISGQISQGGSTLTQQLVKNLFLTRERTFSRKLNEMIMAILLDYHYSKDNILAAYVNEVYLGQNGARGIHGFGTAAEFYFSKPLAELNLEELALLVGIVKGASYYNPRKHPERAQKRRNLVLDAMLEMQFITSAQHQTSRNRSLRVTDKPTWSSAKYPAFLDLVRRHLRRDYQSEQLRNAGLQIHTTLDMELQDVIEKSVSSSLRQLDRQSGFKAGSLETALLAINQHDGEVVALLGDRDREQNAFNRALDARRPIGSLIKPAIYLTALDKPANYHVLSILDDSPLTLNLGGGKSWSPGNYDNRSHGSVPLLRAISKSYNQSTVRLGMQLGLDNVIRTLRNLGIEADIPRLPSLLLGALDLSPYQVTQMYQTIASGGLQVPLKTVRAVLDIQGQSVKRYDLNVREYIKPESAFLTQYLLQQVVESGTAKRLQAELPSLQPLAGKTGTTNDLRDTWFAGFGDRLLTVVWVGRDDNRPTRLTGSTGAMQVWLSIMKKIKPMPLQLIAPGNIDWRSFPDISAPMASCNNMKAYPFITGYAPASVDCF